MGVYAVERFLVGWSAEAVDELLRRIDDATAELGAHGVRHLESIVIPIDETCLSMFVGTDADTVGRANQALGLPFGRILAASIAGVPE
jgi:hypothetical protein